jgi:tetrahydromethanopterin S-methyltransferase subunit A
VLVGGVVHHEVGDDAQAARVGGVEKLLEVLHRPVRRVDAVEVRDVVAVVAKRRGIHRQDPDAVDAELLDVVEPRGEPREVADAVAVAVHERLDVDLVEHRVLVPVERARPCHHQRSTR